MKYYSVWYTVLNTVLYTDFQFLWLPIFLTGQFHNSVKDRHSKTSRFCEVRHNRLLSSKSLCRFCEDRHNRLVKRRRQFCEDRHNRLVKRRRQFCEDRHETSLRVNVDEDRHNRID